VNSKTLGYSIWFDSSRLNVSVQSLNHFISGYMFEGPPLDYVCDVCSKTFHHPESFASHKKFHKGQTTCPHCKHPFSTVGTLNRHIRKVHKVEPYNLPNEDVLDYSKAQPILYNTLNYK